MLVAEEKWEIQLLNGKQSSFLLILQSKPLSFSTNVTAQKHQRKRWEISVMLQAEKIKLLYCRSIAEKKLKTGMHVCIYVSSENDCGAVTALN